MTQEARLYLAKSREVLQDARDFLAINKNSAAGRAAYLAGYHAAQALILVRTGKIAKTHKGVHAEFHKLTQHEPKADIELRRFLSRTYDLKAVADYEVGPNAIIPLDIIKDSISAAERFVKIVGELVDETEEKD